MRTISARGATRDTIAARFLLLVGERTMFSLAAAVTVIGVKVISATCGLADFIGLGA